MPQKLVVRGKLTATNLETQRPIKKVLDGAEYESLLDIGCSAKMLQKVLRPRRYFGIDMVKSTFGIKPDMVLDLKSAKKIPLKSRSFDVVVASQVLEHIPEVGRICAEMRRISKRYIVVGLPNELVYDSRLRFILGKAAYKTYQLIDKPYEIHYWFFTKEVADYFIGREFLSKGWRIRRFFWDFHSSGARLLPYWAKDALAKFVPGLFAKGLYYLLERKR
jgi:SAM-dependent methyltransferase